MNKYVINSLGVSTLICSILLMNSSIVHAEKSNNLESQNSSVNVTNKLNIVNTENYTFDEQAFIHALKGYVVNDAYSLNLNKDKNSISLDMSQFIKSKSHNDFTVNVSDTPESSFENTKVSGSAKRIIGNTYLFSFNKIQDYTFTVTISNKSAQDKHTDVLHAYIPADVFTNTSSTFEKLNNSISYFDSTILTKQDLDVYKLLNKNAYFLINGNYPNIVELEKLKQYVLYDRDSLDIEVLGSEGIKVLPNSENGHIKYTLNHTNQNDGKIKLHIKNKDTGVSGTYTIRLVAYNSVLRFNSNYAYSIEYYPSYPLSIDMSKLIHYTSKKSLKTSTIRYSINKAIGEFDNNDKLHLNTKNMSNNDVVDVYAQDEEENVAKTQFYLKRSKNSIKNLSILHSVSTEQYDKAMKEKLSESNVDENAKKEINNKNEKASNKNLPLKDTYTNEDSNTSSTKNSSLQKENENTLDDISNHKKNRFLPQTGEESYSGQMGSLLVMLGTLLLFKKRRNP